MTASSPRDFIDAQLTKSVALPNAGNTVNSNSIDLGAAGGFPVSEKFQVKISTTAGTAANDKNITIVLQGSNEASANFANISELATLVINEGSSLYAATERKVNLPPGFRYRYLRVSATGEANGGNAADGTLTVALVF